MKNIKKVADFIRKGETTKQKIGIELEHFVCDNSGKMIYYDELSSVIREICLENNWTIEYENQNIVGAECGNYRITLEPAGQLEISIEPCEKITQIEEIYTQFRKKWEGCLRRRGYNLIEKGILPLVEAGVMNSNELKLIPKKRYQYMDLYFKGTGKAGTHMMRATSATQISVDYHSMEDCIRKIRILQKMSPLLALLMENNSGMSREKGHKPYLLRNQIWENVDRDRCGYIPNSFEPEFSYEKYAEYICNKSMIVLTDNNGTEYLPDITVNEYLNQKEIWFEEHLLSMFFFYVRLKQYIEIRVADSVDMERMLGYATLIKELLYNENNLGKIENLLSSIKNIEDIEDMENEIRQFGYDANINGNKVVEILVKMYEIADKTINSVEKQYLKNIVSLPMIEYIYCRNIDNDRGAHAESYKISKEYIMNSTARYHNRVVKSMYIPKLITKREEKIFRGIVDILYSIFNKVINEYINNDRVRQYFDFDKRLEELILCEKQYSINIPMARLDLFYNEQTKEFKFCEFNTDGSSGMNEDRELNYALKMTKAFQDFNKDYEVKTYELFDSWIDQLLSIYSEFAEKNQRNKIPNIVIADFLEKGTITEFEVFCNKIRQRGINCEICDIRDLRWKNDGCFTKKNLKVDLIYRRAVTSDIIEHFEEVMDFVEAFKENAFCLVGDFKTQIIHNKILFKVLHLPEIKKILSEEEKLFVETHIPYTVSLKSVLFKGNEKLWESVLNCKDQWIIKPEDSYGSKGVHAGVESDFESWRKYVEENLEENYILQEFYNPYQLMNIDFTDTIDGKWSETSNLTGLYVYNGYFSGIYSRISYDKMISTQYNEMSLPTIVLDVG